MYININILVMLYHVRPFIIDRDVKQEIADIFVKKGPFLKLYTSYMKDFSEMCAILDDAMKKIPQFHAVVKEFEVYCNSNNS